MRLASRKLLDKSFTSLGITSIVLMCLSLSILLSPIILKGVAAFIFKGTIEHRRLMLEKFNRGNKNDFEIDKQKSETAKKPIYDLFIAFEKELDNIKGDRQNELFETYEQVKENLRHLLGPLKNDPPALLARNQFGTTRWDKVKEKLNLVLNEETWDYSDQTKEGVQIWVPRIKKLHGTSLEKALIYIENNIENIFMPKHTFYYGFFTDDSIDSHMFGGIYNEILGTFYLVIWTMIFAIPMGIFAAIYLVEYASDNKAVRILKLFISTLAGVPSIVFGLFGLSFFINTIKVSNSKSVLAGALTLALLILPTIIKASEEALKAVPLTFKEASLSLGAGKLYTIFKVIFPASLPGVLTGIIISMGRAAGETAPIIFTAAVSLGQPLNLLETLTQPTPALPWNIYNLSTEHEAVEEIRHVQYGMVLTLVALVLLLNLTAIILRARINKKLKG